MMRRCITPAIKTQFTVAWLKKILDGLPNETVEKAEIVLSSGISLSFDIHAHQEEGHEN